MTNDMQLCFIRPSRSVKSGLIESFSGRLRDECLNGEWFSSLDHTRQKLAEFRSHYYHHRPHSLLADRKPAAFAQQIAAIGSPTAPCLPPFAPRREAGAVPLQSRLLQALERETRVN